jgi:hypothetical protein
METDCGISDWLQILEHRCLSDTQWEIVQHVNKRGDVACEDGDENFILLAKVII